MVATGIDPTSAANFGEKEKKIAQYAAMRITFGS